VLETSLDDLIILRSLKHEMDIYDGSYDEIMTNDKFPFYPSNNTHQGKVQTEEEYVKRIISYVADDIEMMVYLGQHKGQSIETAKSNVLYFFKHNITITSFDMIYSYQQPN
jgi:hypothetical protein